MRNSEIFILILGGSKFKADRIEHVCNSWLRNFTHYLISCDGMLREDINHIVATDLNDSHSCPPKIFKGLQHIVNSKSECQWVFIGDDDTFVNYINLVKFIEKLNVKEEKVYGKDMTGNYPYKNRQINYLSGGGGSLMPMHVAHKIMRKIDEKDWMEWLIRPRKFPPKHEGDYPTDAGADTKLGWVMEQMNLTQVSYPHLFHPESYKKYKREAASILNCITYHRQYGHAQKELNDIVFADVMANSVSLTPQSTPKPAVAPTRSPPARNIIPTSYHINTELLLLTKKIKKLEKQIEELAK